MSQNQLTTCTYPGCGRSRVPAPSGGGRPSTYCDDSGHNAATAFRARRTVGAEADEATGLRSASLAGMRLRSVAEQVRDELAGHRDRLEQLIEAALVSFEEAGDPAGVEAELASMRAEMLRTVGDSDAALAAERRDRAAAEDRAAQAERLRDTAEAETTAAHGAAEEARVDAAQAKQAAAEHQGVAAAAVASQEAATRARQIAEEQAQQATTQQARAERDAAEAAEAAARAEAARDQAEERSAQSRADAQAALERAEAAAAAAEREAGAASEARHRADVAEQRVRDIDQMRAVADERAADYRGQLDEYRQREIVRSEETRDRVRELHARIEELTMARQREADRADRAERRTAKPEPPTASDEHQKS